MQGINRAVMSARYWVVWVALFVLTWGVLNVNLRDSALIAMSPFVVLVAYHTHAIREKPFVREMTVQVPDVQAVLDEETAEKVDEILTEVKRIRIFEEKDKGNE